MGIHQASLLASPKKWRLFIYERDKSDCKRRFKRLEHSGYFQQRGNAVALSLAPGRAQ